MAAAMQQRFACAGVYSGARAATIADLPAINGIVDQAVLAWPLAERVKRLSLPLLRYQPIDIDDFEVLLWESAERVVAVAAWDAGAPMRTSDGRLVALLHGLYVEPRHQRQGIGHELQVFVSQRAQRRGIEKIVVKAERVSVPYFERCGYDRVPESVLTGAKFPHLFWRSTNYV